METSPSSPVICWQSSLRRTEEDDLGTRTETLEPNHPEPRSPAAGRHRRHRHRPRDDWDAVHLARTPTLDRLCAAGPWRPLRAHGTAVGLPSDDDMGNSEVGHNALGAGRVFDQGAKLVNRAIDERLDLRGRDVWRQIAERCAGEGGALHLIGLLSDGNVHSHQDQLLALIDERRAASGFPRVCVHVAARRPRRARDLRARSTSTGSRSCWPRSTARTAARYRIASGGGRMVTTMDRYEADWSIVERGWNAHVHGEGRPFALRARGDRDLPRARSPGIIDQFLPPFVVADDGAAGGPDAGRRRGGLLQLPRRPRDRDQPRLRGGRRVRQVRSRAPARRALRRHDAVRRRPADPAAPPGRAAGHRRARWASTWRAAGVTQFACSETQKYGHVTYFWNGNRGGKFDEALRDLRRDPLRPRARSSSGPG